MNDVPSLATIRPHLPPKVAAYVEAILAGESDEDFCRRMGVRGRSLFYHKSVISDWACVPLGKGRGSTVLEVILRARIRELEERQ